MVAVRIVTSGRLLVALVGMKQFKQPKPDAKPLFRGVVQDKLSPHQWAPREEKA